MAMHVLLRQHGRPLALVLLIACWPAWALTVTRTPAAAADGTTTVYLKCLHYGFTIPASSTIDTMVTQGCGSGNCSSTTGPVRRPTRRRARRSACPVAPPFTDGSTIDRVGPVRRRREIGGRCIKSMQNTRTILTHAHPHLHASS